MSNSASLSGNFSESEKEIGVPQMNPKMNDLLLALWINDPTMIDPPPGIVIPKTLKRRSYPLSITRMKKAIKLDHSYCAFGPPAKLCHGCSKIYMNKPLLQCQYCPLTYHLDCLNPPPNLKNNCRWMCPQHPQYMIDCVAALPALAALEQSARALPVNLVKLGKNVTMGSIVMRIGSADGCTLRLDSALCRRVSSNHAVIYMNQAHKFKLINYSEFGSAVVVNNVVLALDKAARPQVGTCGQAGAVEGEACAESSFAQTTPLPSAHPCRCSSRRTELTQVSSMWIPNKCLLEFGCQIFLFRITPDESKPVSLDIPSEQ